jgi:mono/diheme cytochrome c family protein
LFTKRNFGVLVLLAALGLVVFWLLTIPRPLTAADLQAHTPNLANGERLYNASGCHSCHLPGASLTGVDAAVPAGGTPLKTPIGILYPPNLTSDPETGLGNWSDVEFVNAMKLGIGKSGVHLIPAFPYTSYVHMSTADILDIKAHLAALPPVKNQVPGHAVFALPIVRRGLGLWKYIGLDDAEFSSDATQTPEWNRGAYLVNGPGHCNECHTPRTIFMSSDTSRFLQGGPHPEGDGKVPSLVGLVERGRYKDANDVKLALQNGEALGYDKLTAGGMAKVQRNMAKLPDEDVAAIAVYLTSLK